MRAIKPICLRIKSTSVADVLDSVKMAFDSARSICPNVSGQLERSHVLLELWDSRPKDALVVLEYLRAHGLIAYLDTVEVLES